MQRKHRLTVLNPWQFSGNHDVATGYTRAFRLMGYQTNFIRSHILYRNWKEYYKFFAITQGVPNFQYTNETIIQSASINSVLNVMESDPDVLIIIDGTGIHRDAWEWFRRLGIPTIVISTECPYMDRYVTHVAKMATHIFVNDQASADKTGLEYLPVGYDSEIHHPMIVDTTYRHDVVFVGSGFPERVRMLEGVAWDGIDFELYGKYPFDWDHPLSDYYMDEMIPNHETAFLYNGAKISLNLNRTSVDYDGEYQVPEAESLSPRAFEIAGNGGFMISEYRREIDKFFGDLVPTFTTPEQLNELIHYWLPRDKERREIGEQMAKTAKQHSYVERAKVVLRKADEILG
jgi:spore maturation protein CgeB